MNMTPKEKIDALVQELSAILLAATDAEVRTLLGDGALQTLLVSIAPRKTDKTETAYEYLLKNKSRLQLLSLLRLAIHLNYPIKGRVKHTDIYVSPHHIQWFDDGVMFVQGEKQFEGLIGLYQGDRVKFAIARRDRRAGESMGPDDFDFVDVDELSQRSERPSVPGTVEELDLAVTTLRGLLDNRDTNEASYQTFLEAHPWFLGAQYEHIQSHRAFDDANIPDFTGTRVRDSARDILEIKQPFLGLFRADGTLSAEFNDAWNQTERYLDFARRESDYLHRQKGLRFETPKCFLLIGYGLSPTQRTEIQRKERMNPAITVLTYDDLMAMGKATVAFIKALKTE